MIGARRCWGVDFARKRRLTFAGRFWSAYAAFVMLSLVLVHVWEGIASVLRVLAP